MAQSQQKKTPNWSFGGVVGSFTCMDQILVLCSASIVAADEQRDAKGMYKVFQEGRCVAVVENDGSKSSHPYDASSEL